MAVPTFAGFVNSTDIVIASTTLGTAAAFASPALTNGQFCIADVCIYASLPANHGGLVMNWRIPARLDDQSWLLALVRDDWMVAQLNTDAPLKRVLTGPPNDPVHADAAEIAAPGAAPLLLRIRGSCLFQAGAAGGAINLQGAKAGAGASVTILAKSQTRFEIY